VKLTPQRRGAPHDHNCATRTVRGTWRNQRAQTDVTQGHWIDTGFRSHLRTLSGESFPGPASSEITPAPTAGTDPSSSRPHALSRRHTPTRTKTAPQQGQPIRRRWDRSSAYPSHPRQRSSLSAHKGSGYPKLASKWFEPDAEDKVLATPFGHRATEQLADFSSPLRRHTCKALWPCRQTTVATEASEDEGPHGKEAAMTRTITFPFRKICSALPAVALISGSIVLSPSTTPTTDQRYGLASSDGPAIDVSDIAMTPPGPVTGPPHRPRLSKRPPGTVPGISTAVKLDSQGIPVRALEGYRKAASLTASADPACNIDWALLAAIGQVESNHARFGGNQLDSTGTVRPGIIGIPLEGANGTALITDSDRGRLDRDVIYDRAVGPMQFIPSTWRVAGVDADGDGVKNPQDIADAATATAVYLCSGPGDLRRPADLRAAILRYNASDSYVQMVTSIADAYRHGVSALPAFDLASTSPATPPTPPTKPAANHSKPAHAKPASRIPAPRQPRSTQTKASGQRPALMPRAPKTILRTSVPALTRPASIPPAMAAPTQATSIQATPTLTPTNTPAHTTAPTDQSGHHRGRTPLPAPEVPLRAQPAVTVPARPDVAGARQAAITSSPSGVGQPSVEPTTGPAVERLVVGLVAQVPSRCVGEVNRRRAAICSELHSISSLSCTTARNAASMARRDRPGRAPRARARECANGAS
jgi:hypothetical protein